jgi:hypothetical protein
MLSKQPERIPILGAFFCSLLTKHSAAKTSWAAY